MIDKSIGETNSAEDFSTLLRQGRLREAAISIIDNLRKIIEEDIASGNRSVWIDSFNNKTAALFMVLPQNNEIYQLTTEISKLTGEIRIRAESEGKDATEEEKERLIELVEKIKKHLN